MALIVQSASSPATSTSPSSQTTSSQQRRIISASIHSSLNYITLNRDSSKNAEQACGNSVIISKPSCCRQLIHRFDKEAETAAAKEDGSNKKCPPHPPQLIRLSNTQSVFNRLCDHRPRKHPHYDENLTFCPKLNPVSRKLAQERSEKLDEIQSKAALVAATRIARIYADYTFKPVVSERSMRIAQNMGVEFLTRQEQHLQKRQKFLDESLQLLHRPTVICRTKLPKQSDNAPSSTMNNPQQSLTCQTENVTNLKTTLSPRKRVRSKKHSRSLTVPMMSVKSNNGNSVNAPSMSSTPHIIKVKQRRVQDLKKSSPSLFNIKTDSLLEKDFKKLNEFERIKRIKVMAEKVSRAKKVFVVKGGYKTVSKSLRDRGWVDGEYYMKKSKNPGLQYSAKEKSEVLKYGNSIDKEDQENDDSDSDLDEESESDEERADEEQYVMLSRALKHMEPSFIWTLKRSAMTSSYLQKDQMFNHFSKALFTTKCGLYSILNQLCSFAAVDQHSFFPRCYELTSEEERAVFIDDYRLTTAMNIIKIVSCEINSEFANLYQPSDNWALPRVNITCSNPSKSSSFSSTHSLFHQSPSQTSLSAPSTPVKRSRNPSLKSRLRSASSLKKMNVIPEECVLLAIKACEAFIHSKENRDLDQSQTNLCPKLTEIEWDDLISYYYSFVFSDGILFCSSDTAMRTEELLVQVAQFHPQLSMDGIRNLWIVKPGCMSRGRGIVCKNQLEDILSFVKPSLVGPWVIQKYIERPLLIHNTKFDIRQWFLVTNWNPLTMWMYKSCYLRFSTQTYSSQNLDRSIHLCNNSVQKHMSVSESRSSELPHENMWDCDMFKQYLSEQGESNKWTDVIYPGMIEAIKHVLLVSQDFVDDRKNSFELYGADFMITTDYNPWLIEINCSPTMERNTTVTKRMCKEVMEDTIKVVVDRRSNKTADTGNFEMAFKQAKLEVRQYVGINLCVEGASMERKKGNYNLTKPVARRPIPAIDLGKNFNFNSLQRTP